MKKLLTVLLVILMTTSVFLPRQGIAQTPEKMSFQAVIRNSSEALVTNKQIGIQISILQGSASGTAVYAETQTPTTNANGLVSLEIGAGTVVSGTFATIDWSAGPYFIKTETDPAGGISYTITGTSQLLSVPYALHAKTAETITGSISETDPVFTKSPAAKITETHLANLGNPLYRSTPSPIKIETDPIYSASQSAKITTDDISNLRNLSGTNTGDQDGSETKVIAGANVTVTGLGTSIQPYVLNSIIDIGATGPQGIQGTEGLAGPKGDQGDKGEIGLTGAKGEIGLTGDQGPIGLTGTDGATGPQGIQGTEGLAGSKGDQGITGNDGPTGPQGPAGAAGLTTSVNSVIQENGEITLTTTDIPEGDKKYYTDALVAANTAVAANTLKKGITDGTTSGDMQYWSGTAWVIVPSAINEGASLQSIGGVPTWVGGITAPGAVIIGTAAAGDAQARVTFTAPASNGGAAITGYTVTSSPGGGTATGASSPITITGLANGTTYTFTVTATNSAGTGTASAASNSVTPAAGLPNEVVSLTGRTWMDRNLGATQVATSSTDVDSYGDLYQWGRGTDGHQLRSSVTTPILSSFDQPAHGDFILTLSAPYDWLSPQNTNLWQGVNGVNNPCPSGYRLPTEAELNDERLSWGTNNATGAFASPLKLPMAGSRGLSNGSLYDVGTLGFYWSSTVSSTNSRSLNLNSSDADVDTSNRAYGNAVRCLKD
jgi:uncharacterized protein (TIGR02145 family)